MYCRTDVWLWLVAFASCFFVEQDAACFSKPPRTRAKQPSGHQLGFPLQLTLFA
jgi:hypothetical protein